MGKRAIRMGIDVGGTHTKAVAIDNNTNEIVGKVTIKTTHDHPDGVARGVVLAFEQCMKENGIVPEEVIFVAHSTTQATNALIEGDVAKVGIIGVAGGGLEGLLARKQSRIDDIRLNEGKYIHTFHQFISKKKWSGELVENAVSGLKEQGAEVIVASMAFGVDDTSYEEIIQKTAEEQGIMTTMASEITKLYGLTRRTRTAAINASILPKMLQTADSTERSVREAGVEVPLMIMRGDGGVMEISEMKKRPVLTMLSGPAASVMGSLMYLRASNGVYFEVGGTTTNIGVIKNGRPGIDYSVVGGHQTYINSLDVQVVGVAGGSMVRASREGVIDAGPRSAHIAGLDYAVFTDPGQIVNPQVEFFSPKPGDPADYVAIRLESGKRVTITNTCAANVLGLVDEKYFSYGNAEAARKAMAPLAGYMGISVEELAEQILRKSFEKVKTVIEGFAEKYKLEQEQISLVGVGGGAAVLAGYCADKMNLKYSIPENAEVISSIGVALAMVRDVVERVIPTPGTEDIRKIRQEAYQKAIDSGAVPDSIEVHVEVDQTTSKVTAIAIGSNEVKSSEVMKPCTEDEACRLAASDMGIRTEETELILHYKNTWIFGGRKKNGVQPVRILDKNGFIKVQRKDAKAVLVKACDYQKTVTDFWEQMAVFGTDGIIRPDFYICMESRVMDFAGSAALESILMIMDTEVQMLEPDAEIAVIGAKNKL